MRSLWLILPFLSGCAGWPFGSSLSSDLDRLRAVGKGGEGNLEAGPAAKRVAVLPPAALPAVLAAMDGASPVAQNWLRPLAGSIAERALSRGEELPRAELEAFVLATGHSPPARRVAYEWLARVDPAMPDRLIPLMLDDPSVEMRRDAVQRGLEAAEKLFSSGEKERALAAYRKLLPHARDRDQVETIAKRLEALGDKPDLARHFGFIRKWRLIGPFENTKKAGFQAVYPPEEKLDFAAEHQGKAGPVRWLEHTTEDGRGVVDLNKALGKHMGAVAYAGAELEAAEERPIELRAGSSNAIKLWLNGQLLFTRDEYHHGMDPDQYRAPGLLKPGRNTILLKVCQNEGKEDWEQDWTFQLRVCDSTGGGVQ
jgi:hypothetical protein